MKRLAIAGLVMVVALAVIYTLRRSYSEEEHLRFQAGVWRLKHLDAAFNEDLLRARFSLLESYDDFQRHLQEMERLTETLQRPPRFVGDDGQLAIGQAAERFGVLLRERRQLFERFTSRNAIQANSRRYFPVAVNELGPRLGEGASERELGVIVQDLMRVLLASASSAEALPASALAGPDRMQAWAVRHPEHPESGLVANLVQHARQLLAGKSELDALTRQLLVLPLVVDRVRQSKSANLSKLTAMLQEHAADLPGFLTNDTRGRQIPAYLQTLAEQLSAEQKASLEELDHLRKNIEHIKDVVAMQQSYGKVSGVKEPVAIVDLVEDALRMNASALARHGLDVVRDYQAKLILNTDRHKVRQILVNLIRNAKIACDDSGRADKQVTVRITQDDEHVRVAVIDNGVGIPAENLTRIFSHGFTTRNDGHGFGLHSGALAAKELGGELTMYSEGPGHGATFALELPVAKTVEVRS